MSHSMDGTMGGWPDDVTEQYIVGAILADCSGGSRAIPDHIGITARIEQAAFRKNESLQLFRWRADPQPLSNEVTSPPSDQGTKPSNPKDVIGIRKVGLSSLPFRVLWECGVGMTEGALKYGRHNYRAAGIRASVYFDATMRHLGSWWEGEDIDPDSQLSHITKAIVSLMVLRDGMIQGNWSDDRPIGQPYDLSGLHVMVGDLMDKHKDKSPHHYTRNDP